MYKNLIVVATLLTALPVVVGVQQEGRSNAAPASVAVEAQPVRARSPLSELQALANRIEAATLADDGMPGFVAALRTVREGAASSGSAALPSLRKIATYGARAPYPWLAMEAMGWLRENESDRELLLAAVHDSRRDPELAGFAAYILASEADSNDVSLLEDVKRAAFDELMPSEYARLAFYSAQGAISRAWMSSLDVLGQDERFRVLASKAATLGLIANDSVDCLGIWNPNARRALLEIKRLYRADSRATLTRINHIALVDTHAGSRILPPLDSSALAELDERLHAALLTLLER